MLPSTTRHADGTRTNHPARRLWQLAEPIHAVTYFAPDAHRAFEKTGLREFWRGYFAGRAAPMGPVGAGVVTASFFGFHPAFVARAVPSIWSIAEPARAIDARLAGADEALRRIAGDLLDPGCCATAAGFLRAALVDCSRDGRPLFAANLDLDWPGDPHLALWHAATLVREFRGDRHVAALMNADLGPCEAHVTQVAMNGVPLGSIKPYRGWGDDDYETATERLRVRGWLTRSGTLTERGREGRDAVEADTDRLAGETVERLGADRLAQVTDALTPLVSRLQHGGVIPYPNPMGVPSMERPSSQP